MMAIIGMFYQDGLTGSAWGDWASYTDSPLRAFESELGVQAPLGFWDPIGFTKDGDAEKFRRRRSTEIKHGRISMLATMGYITPEVAGKFPGMLSPSKGIAFEDVPNGLAALSKVPQEGWLQMIAYCWFCERSASVNGSATEKGKYVAFGEKTPGDVGWKPPLLSGFQGEAKTKKLNAEIANGRLAMMAIIGMFYQDGLTGSAWGDWASYTDSPLRAFESELGVQAPLGFWDPIGFTKDGDAEKFRRRRSTEIKHGRISMLATMGYITPEVAGKFPGMLSPSKGIAFEDVPNGLAALSKVPQEGWLQMIAYCWFCERSASVNGSATEKGKYVAFGEKTPGDVGWKPPLLSGFQGEAKTKKLNAEIANGRLAMMAIIGMFYQDGLTGSAWGDWASYTDSPLRAFESELGVQAPLGFWDPIGFTKDGDAEKFRRRRSTEIKHGRISMLATMGYITPEVAGKFPGMLSPSKGIAFEDVPNGLAALSKVPQEGWLQMIAYCWFCERSASVNGSATEKGKYVAFGEKTPGDVGWKPPLLSGFQGEAKTKKLNAEIANGRLAMMAIIGMFYQDGLTGSAWGDWASYTDSPLR
ncbi:unnamed protein product [Prorocentrum cordatum]|nr:unnamed protein product [Polarella glacialis]